MEFDTSDMCVDAFKKLKELVLSLFEDLTKGQVIADHLLSNLYRWLSSPSSKLYDPQLFDFVNQLMKKSFSMMIKRFTDLGANVIYASYNKIIIETKKKDYEQAENYINFAIQSIMSDPTFKYI